MKLRDICEYRNEKIGAEGITPESYVSTESMLPNRSGIAAAASIPTSGKVNLYHQGDTLVSSIRPYFKKIWQASRNGCCSNDILVFQPKDNCNGDYLHWVLSNETFFDYVTATAKGTKMPRGDKAAIMQFSVPDFNANQQLKVASLLNPIQKKIELNAKLNGYLEKLLLTKYDELFPANADFTGILSDVGEVIGGATPSKKRPEYYCSNGIGWITPRDLSNTTDKFIAHGADDITDVGYASCSAKILPKGSVLFSSRAPIGYVAIAADRVATNQGFKSVVPREEVGTAFIYCFLIRNKQRIADRGAGTTFPEISGRMMKSVGLAIPEQASCAEFSSFAKPIFEQQEALEEENRKLAALRDALLPKLMSGEIDVSKVDLTQLNSHLTEQTYTLKAMQSRLICR